MGRPRKICDEANIIELASKGRTLKEIAAFCDVSEDTIDRNYADAVRKGHALREGSLRSKQFQVAMRGDSKMLIWLGKQLLGQTDKSEISGSGLSLNVQIVNLIDRPDRNVQTIPASAAVPQIAGEV